jgi:hypothetical protein
MELTPIWVFGAFFILRTVMGAANAAEQTTNFLLFAN